MKLNWSRETPGVLGVSFEGKPLLAYRYQGDDVLPEEVPKPCLHPLRTLGGSVVTLYRPNDHPWHKGVGMTLTRVDDTNFWGGVTYTRDQGYTWLNNHGRQRHVGWVKEPGPSGCAHEISWESEEGRPLLRELRTLQIAVYPEHGYWTLDLGITLTNVKDQVVTLGNYEASEGLAGSFYTGLFWRMPREFLDRIHTTQYNAKGAAFCQNLEKDDEHMHGQASRWIALHGSTDGVVEPVTVALIDRSAPGVTEPRVFLRRNQVGIALPFHGSSEVVLPPGGSLPLRYRLLLADGHWEAEALVAYCDEVASAI